MRILLSNVKDKQKRIKVITSATKDGKVFAPNKETVTVAKFSIE